MIDMAARTQLVSKAIVAALKDGTKGLDTTEQRMAIIITGALTAMGVAAAELIAEGHANGISDGLVGATELVLSTLSQLEPDSVQMVPKVKH